MKARNLQSFAAGGAIGTLGGLMGLGGAEFRLPVLKGLFRFATLEAILLNLATSLVLVAFALLFRSQAVTPAELWGHAGLVLNLLAGSLAGSWIGAHIASRIHARHLDLAVMVLLIGLSIVLMAEPFLHLSGGGPLFDDRLLLAILGVAAGLGIGLVSSLLGVAGGELLIPTFMLLYGVDIKLAGSLALAVSLPTLVVGLLRYRRSDDFPVIRRERRFLAAMATGSILGAAIGGLMLGLVPSKWLTLGLGIILLISAIKLFRGH